MDTLTTRPAADRDDELIAELTNVFIRETVIHFGLSETSAEDYRRLRAEAGDRFPWLVGEVDGDFAGYAKASPWRLRDAYANTCETTVYVDARFHRRGVARRLMLDLLDRLRERGFHVAVAGATLPNEGSERLHEALGFEPAGVFREVGRKFDAWHDVGFWQMRL